MNSNKNLGFLKEFNEFNLLKKEYDGNVFPLSLSIFISLIISIAFYAFLFLKLNIIAIIFIVSFILLFLFFKLCFKKMLKSKIKSVKNEDLKKFLNQHKHLKDYGYSYYRELLKENIKERGF